MESTQKVGDLVMSWRTGDVPLTYLCAAKVAERKKKTKNYPFFISKFLNCPCSNVPTKECSGLELHRTGSDVSDNAGVYVATLQVQLSHCCCRNRLEQLRKHPAAGGSRKKIDGQCEIFLREKFAKKNAFLSAEIWVWKRGKNLRPFSQIFGPGPLAGVSFSKSHTSRCSFSAWQQSLLRWLCSQNVSPACQQNVLCEKAAKPSKEFWWCLVGRAPFLKNNREKIEKKSHDEVLHRAVAQVPARGKTRKKTRFNFSLTPFGRSRPTPLINWRRTNVQQLTCKMVGSFSFFSLLVSFRLFELKQ